MLAMAIAGVGLALCSQSINLTIAREVPWSRQGRAFLTGAVLALPAAVLSSPQALDPPRCRSLPLEPSPCQPSSRRGSARAQSRSHSAGVGPRRCIRWSCATSERQLREPPASYPSARARVRPLARSCSASSLHHAATQPPTWPPGSSACAPPQFYWQPSTP